VIRTWGSVYAVICSLAVYTKRFYLTYHLRPKYAIDLANKQSNEIANKKLAIIIQGPLLLKDDFTYQTILVYKKIFKGAKIILSTWIGENEETIRKIEGLDVNVILNEYPITNGYGNVNLQLKSTKKGLELARDLDYEFSMKTRTDQRLYRQDLFQYFISLVNVFPLQKDNIQKKRLIVSSLKTCKYRLYSLSDMLMFGDTSDVLLYWSSEYYDEGNKPYFNSKNSEIPPIVNGTPIMTEIYLTLKYMETLGIKPTWTLHDWWKFCKDYFCVVDSNMIDQYWPKYKSLSEYWFIKDYSNNRARSLQFADWIQLYCTAPSSWDNNEKPEFYSYKNGKVIGWEQNQDTLFRGYFNPKKC